MSNITSPCIRQCCLNEYDICLGCFRTLSEIKQWQQLSEQARLKIMQAAQARQKRPLNVSL